MKLSWRTWFIVLIAVVAAGEGLGALLRMQGWTGTGVGVALAGRAVSGAWVLYGLWAWREVRWVRRASGLIAGTVALLLAIAMCQAAGWRAGGLAAVGVYLMGVGFFVGLLVIRVLLSGGHPVLGVARTLVDEAIRMKVAAVFIVVLVLLVPVLPLVLDPGDFLKYRIQTFLTWSLMAVGGLLSVMTILVAVGTITRELGRRQMFLTMTKPVSRAQYLAGKWLGLALLNLLLVAVCGAGIHQFTQVLAQQQARDEADRVAVHQQVLVARRAERPAPPAGMDFPRLYRERLAELQAQDPTEYGASPAEVPPAQAQQIQQTLFRQWHSVGPQQTQTYIFNNLAPGGTPPASVQLRLKPEAASSGGDGMVYLNMRLNGRPYPVPPLSEGSYHVLDIPGQYIGADGRLEMVIANPMVEAGRPQPSISFNTNDGLQVLYRVGSFEANLARALGLLWIRLCFLAMLGLAAGTFLGFPTASLLSMMIYIAAAFSGYLGESMTYYAAFPGETLSLFEKLAWLPNALIAHLGAGEVLDAVKILIRLVGQGFLLLVPSFAEYNSTPLIADGQQISNALLADAALWVGLVWTGSAAVIGWLIFRSRELARVTV